MPEETGREESAVALRNTIQRALEEFRIEPSVISDALNFAAQSPDDTGRFLQEVFRRNFLTLSPIHRLQLEAYRHDPTLLAVRQRVGLALIAEAILETEATPDDCATALRDLGLLLNEGRGEVVKTIANRVHFLERKFSRRRPKRSLFNMWPGCYLA